MVAYEYLKTPIGQRSMMKLRNEPGELGLVHDVEAVVVLKGTAAKLQGTNQQATRCFPSSRIDKYVFPESSAL